MQMDLKWTLDSLRTENQSLRQQIADVKRENHELQSKLNTFSSPNIDESVIKSAEEKKRVQWADSVDETVFQRSLSNNPQLTSSPVKRPYENLEITPPQIAQPTPGFCSNLGIKDVERLAGEIVFQLDMRILLYVFQEQKRLYGFTVRNIRKKINEVSISPLTGKVDKAYKTRLLGRYLDLMERLRFMGYNVVHHPQFAEVTVNTYGLLNAQTDMVTLQKLEYNNTHCLQELIIQMMPPRLLKDLLILLRCLSQMAKDDGKALFLWWPSQLITT